MSDRITTKAGVFESGDQDAMGVQYKDGRLIACRNPRLTDYAVADGNPVIVVDGIPEGQVFDTLQAFGVVF